MSVSVCLIFRSTSSWFGLVCIFLGAKKIIDRTERREKSNNNNKREMIEIRTTRNEIAF